VIVVELIKPNVGKDLSNDKTFLYYFSNTSVFTQLAVILINHSQKSQKGTQRIPGDNIVGYYKIFYCTFLIQP